MAVSHQAWLLALRAKLKAQKLDGFIVPRQDEFQGESVAAYAERLKWLTGFAGSWGTAIVLARKAALFVDGRYTVLVREQVTAKGWQFKNLIDEPPHIWAAKNLKRGARLGYDPMLHTIAEISRFAKALASSGVKLVAVKRNLVDMVWHDQPPRAQASLFVQPEKWAGKSSHTKLKELGAALGQQQADAAFISDPASVAWMFNLRGRDVPHAPVVLAYVIFHARGKAALFVEDQRLPVEVKRALKATAVVHPPSALAKQLRKLKGKAVVLDESSTPQYVYTVLTAAKAKIILAKDPCTLPKARKNAVERQGARDAQLRDGAALSQFLHWLAQEAPKGRLTEAAAAQKLLGFRQQSNLLEDISFATISAAGRSAAMPHYHMPASGGRKLGMDEIFLVDSGGQYRDGTTDVTRTVIIGTPTAEMKDRFTRVLKGMIALALIRFPAGTTGAHLDVLARAALWQAGLDYDHGTGHGIGSYLCVHEGPAGISRTNHVALQPGMILSDEPGYYKPDHYGIRIENLLMVYEAEDIVGGERKMMGFETLTLAPIDRHLIDSTLLTSAEVKWLDAYHARVEKELSPHLPETTQGWLKRACAPL